MTAFDAGAIATAVGACAIDVRAARVPNTITMTSALAGLLAHAVLPGGAGIASSVLGVVVGLLVFFPFFALGGLGGGDVKLMAALGAWLGARDILSTALYTALAGGVLAVAVAVQRNYLRQALRNLGALARLWAVRGIRPEPSLTLDRGHGPRLPYAVPMLVGLLVMLWQR